MEGRVLRKFYLVQQWHLLTTESRMNWDKWIQGFIDILINISHSQWLLRNFTLHDKQCRFRRMKDKVEVILQIEELIHTDPNQILEHSCSLLEIDPNSLDSSSFYTQTYWVAAMVPAGGHKQMQCGTTSHDQSGFGIFQVREAIRVDMRDMHHVPKVRP